MKKVSLFIMAPLLTFSMSSAHAKTCAEVQKRPTFHTIAHCEKLSRSSLPITSSTVNVCVGSEIDPRDNAKIIFIWGKVEMQNGNEGYLFPDPNFVMALGETTKPVGESTVTESAKEDQKTILTRTLEIWPSANFDTNKDFRDSDFKAAYDKEKMRLDIEMLGRANFPVKELRWEEDFSYTLECHPDNE